RGAALSTVPQLAGHYADRRPVARDRLGICVVGFAARLLSGGLPIVGQKTRSAQPIELRERVAVEPRTLPTGHTCGRDRPMDSLPSLGAGPGRAHAALYVLYV